MNILLTGVAGFIGSHTAESLINDGHHVTGIDNFDPFYAPEIKRKNIARLLQNDLFRLKEADIRDRAAMNEIFSSGATDLVIHLAAKAGVRPSIESPYGYFDVNVQGTLVLLEAMHQHNVSKMVFASSSSVYGNNNKVPFSEDDPVNHPVSPYAASKKSGELLCHTFHHLYQFDITCLRFFTAFGPRQRPDLAIHKFVKLIDQGKPIPMFGDGTTSRDYTYISDIVTGIRCAIENMGGYSIYNLGESRTIELKQVIQTIEEVLKKKAIIEELPPVKGDVEITFADISKARKEIGYNPKYGFKQGIESFVSWYQENKHNL